MIVPRGRLARCSSRGDALFGLAGRKFAPAKIAGDEPWEVVPSLVGGITIDHRQTSTKIWRD